MKYGCIIADPPWQYSDKMLDMKSTGDGAAAKYPCMTEFDIQNFLATGSPEYPLGIDEVIAPDAHLWLWTTNAFMEAGHRVARAWGFTPKTIVTWVKGRLDIVKWIGPEQDPEVGIIYHIGQGHYLRNCTEHCIFAVRGSAPPKLRNVGTAFIAPRGKHSEKPDTIHQWAQLISPGPYLELFARRPHDGWTVYGNEVSV